MSEDADMPDYQAEEASLSYPGPDNDTSIVSNSKRGRETMEDDDYDD
jgi:hypothetical protein